MKRQMPWNDHIDVISSDSSSGGEVETGDVLDCPKSFNNGAVDHPPKEMSPEGMLLRSAEMYQDYMKNIAIPLHRGSLIPCSSWTGLASSLKKLYGQPLHYLTNILLKQWDQMRVGSDDEHQPLDAIMHPVKAETTIWLIEEVHRRTACHHHIAKLWMNDHNHSASLDSVFPDL